MNILYYILIQLSGIPLRILSAILYLIVFLFRHKVLKFMLARVEEDKVNRVFVLLPGTKKWKLYLHPYFWMFCFTTGLTNNYCGPNWYKWNFKEKLWRHWGATFSLSPSYMIKYFYICYCWQALRNSHWAFNEWFFREGKWRDESQKVIYCKSPKPIPWWDIMPEAKWDEGNDGGKQLRWPTPETPLDEEWMCTHEGTKLINFTTHRGNKRFYFGHCKVYYFKKHFLVIQYLFGWNWWNGIPVFHFKHILRKK